MATTTIVMFISTVKKDRISRLLLRKGFAPRFLWVLFVVPKLGRALIDGSREATLYMHGRYSEHPARFRRIRFNVAILRSSFVKILTRYWYSDEAVSSRVRPSTIQPCFLYDDRLTPRDFGMVVVSIVHLSVAFFYH